MTDERKCDLGERMDLVARLPDGRYLAKIHLVDHSARLAVSESARPSEIGMEHDCSYWEPMKGGGFSRMVESRPSKGPAKVSTAAYRAGWDGIFGGRKEVGSG